MTGHHIICGATTPGVFDGDHEHECHQPAGGSLTEGVLKHKCFHCTATWTERIGPRPAPDTSWVVTEEHPKPLKHPRVWGCGAALAALALCTIAGALIAEAVNRG